jgi:hypothetical protein
MSGDRDVRFFSKKEDAQMTRRTRSVLFVVAGFLATAAVTSAQEAAGSFDALAGSIQVGQRIWVTDVTGREDRGRLERLSSDALTLKASGLETFAAADVQRPGAAVSRGLTCEPDGGAVVLFPRERPGSIVRLLTGTCGRPVLSAIRE